MCGLTGWFDFRGQRYERGILEGMAERLHHRGPDSGGFFMEEGVALGFRRLAIIDLVTGDQPLFNEDERLVLVCNGEIYNHRELRAELEEKGHAFRTRSDVEVLLHLYEEHGEAMLERLNGQFSFALYDRAARQMLLARDPFGVTPLFYAEIAGAFLFGSEIKTILEHPAAPRQVDLTGLDQVLTFPGLVGSRTLFAGIRCLEAGHFLRVSATRVENRQYWDLVYPTLDEAADGEPESFYVEGLRERLEQAVRYRMQADVPVGFYLSGGVDSSLIGALIARARGGQPGKSFSISFADTEISEARYQRLMAEHLGSEHFEIFFDWREISDRLQAMIYHCECPLKETFDTCAMALSEAARRSGVPVVLAGQGADELFAGYMGYRFDQAAVREASFGLDAVLEAEIRETLWGDPELFYEIEFVPLREVKAALYARELAGHLPEFECTRFPVVAAERLRGRHPLHQRSYLDVKLRLSEHLLSEHGDRMVLANSVEGRYPFLDSEVVAFTARIPPQLKLNGLEEKYIVKKVAEGLVPEEIIRREKFGFRAPGTPYLLQQKSEWIEDLLSYERIRSQGYFNPDFVERLKTRYRQPGFKLNAHLETDYLMIVLTFGILVDLFKLPTGRARGGADALVGSPFLPAEA